MAEEINIEVESLSEIELEILGQQGPKGAKGDKGDKGDDGSQGPRGFAGATGPKGDKGNDGEQGDPGPQGDAGPQGEPGEQGPAGQAGDIGPQGEPGSAGPKGDQGNPGAKGDAGERGPVGETGPAGPKGDTGDVGPKGDQGDQGPKGDKGETGDVGPAGEQGETGAPGERGNEGEQGPQGQSVVSANIDGDGFLTLGLYDPIFGGSSQLVGMVKGEQGPAGVDGARGETGPKGDKGDQGDVGDTGPEGPEGPQGPTGPAGSGGSATGVFHRVTTTDLSEIASVWDNVGVVGDFLLIEYQQTGSFYKEYLIYGPKVSTSWSDAVQNYISPMINNNAGDVVIDYALTASEGLLSLALKNQFAIPSNFANVALNAPRITVNEKGVITNIENGPTIPAWTGGTTAESVLANCVNGEPAFDYTGGDPTFAVASINGTNVTFNVVDQGYIDYQAAYCLEQDMAFCINAANIPGIRAYAENNKLIIVQLDGQSITIVNVSGPAFAGPASASGVALFTKGVYLPTGGVDGKIVGHVAGAPAWVDAPTGGGGGGGSVDLAEIRYYSFLFR